MGFIKVVFVVPDGDFCNVDSLICCPHFGKKQKCRVFRKTPHAHINHHDGTIAFEKLPSCKLATCEQKAE